MKNRILRYFKHIIVTLLIGIPVFILIGLFTGNTLKYSRNDLVDNWNNEGPYIFFKSDSLLQVNYIKGDVKEGFEVESFNLKTDSSIELNCYYPIDSSSFNLKLKTMIN